VRGFAFIDICRKKFDVVLMNPPFGDSTENSVHILSTKTPLAQKNLYMAFVLSNLLKLQENGSIGAITDATFIHQTRYEGFRNKLLTISDKHLYLMAACGWGVLDSYVETAAYVINSSPNHNGVFMDIRHLGDEREATTLRACVEITHG
jgi:type I restriction-modification system DNA methylase subunit